LSQLILLEEASYKFQLQ